MLVESKWQRRVCCKAQMITKRMMAKSRSCIGLLLVKHHNYIISQRNLGEIFIAVSLFRLGMYLSKKSKELNHSISTRLWGHRRQLKLKPKSLITFQHFHNCKYNFAVFFALKYF